MASNPINLVLRFVLELVALAAYGYWGWTQHQGFGRLVIAIVLPVAVAIIWAVFRFPEGDADVPVTVAGPIRLLLEFMIFGVAIWLLSQTNLQPVAAGFAIVVIIHYLVSYDRVLAMLSIST